MIVMTENKRFTDIEHDFENARIRCKDNGMFMLYAIYENDDGLPTLGDLLNELSDENKQLKQQNIELQERNDRQYDRLTYLWECIRNKDYETLQKKWEEIEEADKKLQEEWKCYNESCI